MPLETEISATEFKAKCLQILDQVSDEHATIIVTKHGKPVARVVPIIARLPPLKGSGIGTFGICGDLLDFDTSGDWDVVTEPLI